MDYKNNLSSKTLFLESLNALPLREVWEDFSKLQVDLFYKQELEIFRQSQWWLEAKSVLHLGCREGYFLSKLYKDNPEKHYVGVDTQVDCIDYAIKHFSKPTLSFQHAQNEDGVEQFEKKFDVVLFCMHLQHSKDPIFSLTAAQSYLKTGGRIIIIDSYDPLRSYSQPMPFLEAAIENFNTKRQSEGKKSRFASFELLRAFDNKSSSLARSFVIENSNLLSNGKQQEGAIQFEVRSSKSATFYFLYHMLFLQLLSKQWQIKIDFEKSYEEAYSFKENPTSWLISGKHYLILKSL